VSRELVRPVVRELGTVTPIALAPGVSGAELLGDEQSYDEVVHVLSGRGIVHLDGSTAAIRAGTSIYLPPYQPHCLENTGPEPLEVLGVFYPAGSPAAKRAC
jgi:mannose-6-phosphate isomerase-like protein (cupin superfamily)